MVKLLLLLSFLTFNVVSHAQVAKPDPSFGRGGILYSALNSAIPVNLNSIAVQSDGKIIVVGGINLNEEEDFVIARFNQNGTLDNTFSSDGIQKTGFFNGSLDIAFAVALQGDKIVVAGYTSSPGNTNFAIARYNSNGTLDKTFDGDGKVTTTFNSTAVGRALAIQGDKIIVAGYTYDNTPIRESNFVIVRFNNNGTMDRTFSGDGVQTTDIRGYGDYIHNIVLKGDKIVAGGDAIYDGRTFEGNTTIAQYKDDGSLDKTFSKDGLQTTSLKSSSALLAIQEDKIVVGANGRNDFILTRYNADGSLDNTFSDDGVQRTNFGTSWNARVNSMVAYKDQLILVGNLFNASDFTRKSVMVKYNFDGSVDNPGVEKGIQTLSVNEMPFIVSQLAVHKNKLYAAGSIGDGQPSVAAFLLDQPNEKQILKDNSESNSGLTVKVIGNPTQNSFTLVTKSNSSEPIYLKVSDNLGRSVDFRSGIKANTTLTIGNEYRKGMYYAEVLQGDKKVLVKLIKL